MRHLATTALVTIALAGLLAIGVGVLGHTVGSTRTGDANAPATVARGAEPPAVTTTTAGHCDGALVREEVREVSVPAGATCVLVDTEVGSNVSLAGHASIRLDRSRVDGDLEGEDARSVQALRSRVGGNLQLEGGGSATLLGSHVDGDVEWQDQHGRLVVRHSSVGGSLELDENAGPVQLVGNRVDGDLECDGNRSLPRGSGNVVRGQRKEQCRHLGPGVSPAG